MYIYGDDMQHVFQCYIKTMLILFKKKILAKIGGKLGSMIWVQAYKMSSKYPEEMMAFKQKIKNMKDVGYNRYKSESFIQI